MRAPVVLALGLLACTPRPRPCAGKSRLELRSVDGTLQLRVAETEQPGRLDLCDAAGQPTGALLRKGQALSVVDPGHVERLRAEAPSALELTGPAGPAVRLYRGEDVLRVLHPDGVPYGAVQSSTGQALVTDRSGTPVARVTRRDADALITGATDGAVHSYVVPGPHLGTAAVLALPELSLQERVLLYAHLERGPLQP